MGLPKRARLASMLGVVLSVVSAETARATILGCPAGTFAMEASPARGGTMLALSAAATVELVGVCAPARARGRYYPSIPWAKPFRVRWTACDPAADVVALRARFRDGCTVLRGKMRMRSGAVHRVVAHRVPFCGDGIVSPGEDCDDPTDVHGTCCAACRAQPGCWTPCERSADCAPEAVCWRHDDTCRATRGVCRLPWADQCNPSQFPVCGCDGRAYASECDAWAAGVTVQGGDGLNQAVGARCHCRPGSGSGCGPGRFCEIPTGFCDPSFSRHG